MKKRTWLVALESIAILAGVVLIAEKHYYGIGFVLGGVIAIFAELRRS